MKRFINFTLALTLCFATVVYFKIPKLPTIPNITKSITLPTIKIPAEFLDGIKGVL